MNRGGRGLWEAPFLLLELLGSESGSGCPNEHWTPTGLLERQEKMKSRERLNWCGPVTLSHTHTPQAE